MTNRELLELAALAAGYEATSFADAVYIRKGNAAIKWKPREDDGDAFRLMVKLGMDVYVDNHPEGCKCVEVESVTHNVGRFIENFRSHESQEAATRIAIVRCAAEIGRWMKEEGDG